MSSATSNGLKASARHQSIVGALTQILAKLFGKETSEVDTTASLVDLGGDSLFVLQASSAIREKFRVKIPFRLLLEELSTIQALAAHLDQKLEPQFVLEESSGRPYAKPSPAVSSSDARVAIHAVSLHTPQPTENRPLSQPTDHIVGTEGASSANESLYQIFAQQLSLMSAQIALLTAHPLADTQTAEPFAESANPLASLQPSREDEPALSTANSKSAPSTEIEPEVYVPYHAIQGESKGSLSPDQRQHIEALIQRINRKTGESKRITQQYRKYHADNRTAAGFRMPWKEMFYPLVVDRGQGSHIWDVDGNEYIDMTMGFGALLFGHSPDFIVDELSKQLTRGIRLGPHSREAGEAARLICELTGVERVAFVNSGTEAIMTALRLARTVTGRSRIALFEGCYHGTFDGILVKGQRTPAGKVRAVPLAPGVSENMIADVLMLKYDDPESLDILRSQADDLAAVLIEPPRSRRPDVQPRDFLLELRRITEASGTALIFDEVVTGFRFHPGGAQALFGIRADLVTYGKAIGGGLPVAVVAGKSAFMDAVDGGMWQYGDSSYPESEITFFTGTYFKHPLIMPAVVATLNHIKNSGSQLQESLNAKATRAVSELESFIKAERLPLRVAQLGSLFRILHGPELRNMDLFYYHLLDKGVYVCETHNCLVSTAHSDSDMEAVIRAAKESMIQLREGGFLPSATRVSVGWTEAGGNSPNTRMNGDSVVRVPLTEAQRQIWAVSHMGDEDSPAYNLPLEVQWKGDLDVPLLQNAVNLVVQRHEAFRATFSVDGDFQNISPLTLEIPVVDLSRLAQPERDAATDKWRKSEGTRAFDFVTGPLLSLRLLRLGPDLHVLLITMHHIISDGWSLGMFLSEMQEVYGGLLSGKSPQLPTARSFVDYARTKSNQEALLSESAAEAFWTNEFPSSIPPTHLPADFHLAEESRLAGEQKRAVMKTPELSGLKEIARRYSSTRFMVLLAVCKVFVYYLSKQEEVVIGIPTAGQSQPDGGYLAGCCVNLLAFRTQMNTELSFPQLVVLLRQKLVKAYEHEDYPFNRLLQRLRTLHPSLPDPNISVIFNLDRAQAKKKEQPFDITVATNHNRTSKFDLTIDITETPDSLVIDFEYKRSLFSSQRVGIWMELFQTLIREVNERPTSTVREYFSVLHDEEMRLNTFASLELNRHEQQRLTDSKRKPIAS